MAVSSKQIETTERRVTDQAQCRLGRELIRIGQELLAHSRSAEELLDLQAELDVAIAAFQGEALDSNGYLRTA